MSTELHIQEIAKGLDLETPIDKLENGVLVDALNVGVKAADRRGGELVPSIGQTPMNYVFHSAISTDTKESLSFYLQGKNILSYDFGDSSCFVKSKLVGDNTFYVFYIIRPYLWTDDAMTSENGIVLQPTYEVIEYFKTSSYKIDPGCCCAGKMNDGIPTIYMALDDGMYMIVLDLGIEAAIAPVQSRFCHLKPKVTEFFTQGRSYAPPGITVYFYDIVCKVGKYERTLLRSSFSDKIYIPYSMDENDYGSVNMIWSSEDWDHSRLTPKSKIKVRVVADSIKKMFEEGNTGGFNLSKATTFRLYAIRFLSSTGFTVSEEYPYAIVEMVDEVRAADVSEFTDEVIMTDGDSPYMLPEGIFLQDLRTDARTQTLFDKAKTILIKDGIFYAANVFKANKVSTTSYDCRVWQFNAKKQARVETKTYTLDQLVKLDSYHTLNFNYLQTDLVRYYNDFSEYYPVDERNTPEDEYCMFRYEGSKLYHGAMGENINITFVRGKMDAGGVYPDVSDIEANEDIQTEQIEDPSICMNDNDYRYSAFGRFLNSPFLDIGSTNNDCFYNTDRDPSTGCKIHETMPVEDEYKEPCESIDIGTASLTFKHPIIASTCKCMQHDSVYWLACKFVYTDNTISETIPIGAVRTPSMNINTFRLYDDHVPCIDALQEKVTPPDDSSMNYPYDRTQFTEIMFYPIYMHVEFKNLPPNVKSVHVMYQMRNGMNRNVKGMGIVHQTNKPISPNASSNLAVHNIDYGDINPGYGYIYKGEEYIKGRTDDDLGLKVGETVTQIGLKQEFYDEGAKYSLTPLPGVCSQQYYYGGAISSAATDLWNTEVQQSNVNLRKENERFGGGSASGKMTAHTGALVTNAFMNSPGSYDYCLGKFHLVDSVWTKSDALFAFYTSRMVVTNQSNTREKVWMFHSPELDICDNNGTPVIPYAIDTAIEHMNFHGSLWSVFGTGYERQNLSACYSEMNDSFANFFTKDIYPAQSGNKVQDLYFRFADEWPGMIDSGGTYVNSTYDGLYFCTDYNSALINIHFTNDMTDAHSGIGSILSCNYSSSMLGDKEGKKFKKRAGKELDDDVHYQAALLNAERNNRSIVQPEDFEPYYRKRYIGTVENSETKEKEKIAFAGEDIPYAEYKRIMDIIDEANKKGITPKDVPPGKTEPEEVEVAEVTSYMAYMKSVYGFNVFSGMEDWVESKLNKGYQGESAGRMPNKKGIPPRSLKFFIHSDIIGDPQYQNRRRSVTVDMSKVVDFAGYNRLTPTDLEMHYGYLWPCSIAPMKYNSAYINQTIIDTIKLDNGINFVNLSPLWSGKTSEASAGQDLPTQAIYSGSDRNRFHSQAIGHSIGQSGTAKRYPIHASYTDAMITPFGDFGLPVNPKKSGLNNRTVMRDSFEVFSSAPYHSIGTKDVNENDTIKTRLGLPDISQAVFPDVTYYNPLGLLAAYKNTIYIGEAEDNTPSGKTGELTDQYWEDPAKSSVMYASYCWRQLFHKSRFSSKIHDWYGAFTMDLWCGLNHSGLGGRGMIFTTYNTGASDKYFPSVMRNTYLDTLDPSYISGKNKFIARRLINNDDPNRKGYAIYIKDERPTTNILPHLRGIRETGIITALRNGGVNVLLTTMRAAAPGYASENFNQKEFVTAGVVPVANGSAVGVVHNFDTYLGIHKKLYTHAYYASNQFHESATPSSPTIMMFPYEGPINVEYMNSIDDILKENRQFSSNRRMTLRKGYNFQGRTGNYTQKTDMYGYNMVYSANLSWEPIFYTDTSEALSEKNRMYWSDFNEDGVSVRSFKPENYMEFDPQYGEIKHIHSYGENIVVMQDNGIALTTPNLPNVAVGTQGGDGSQKLTFISSRSGNPTADRDLFPGRYSYITHSYGIQESGHYSCLATDKGMYWIDSASRQFCALGNGSVTSLNNIAPWIVLSAEYPHNLYQLDDSEILITAMGEVYFPPSLDPVGVGCNVKTPSRPAMPINRNVILFDDDYKTFCSFLTMANRTVMVTKFFGDTVSLIDPNWNRATTTGDQWGHPMLLKEKNAVFYPLWELDFGSQITSYINIPDKCFQDKNFYSIAVLNKDYYDKDRIVRISLPYRSKDELVQGADSSIIHVAQAYHYKKIKKDNIDGNNLNEYQKDLWRAFSDINGREFVSDAGQRWTPLLGEVFGSHVFFSVGRFYTRKGENQPVRRGPMSGIGIYVTNAYQTHGILSTDEAGRFVMKNLGAPDKKEYEGFRFRDRDRAYFCAFGVGYEPLELF